MIKLKDFKWISQKQLFAFMQEVDSKKFSNCGLLDKELFIDKLYAQLQECERYGKTLADIRETFGNDFIQDNFPNDYWYLMQRYKEERKKLKKLLSIINTVVK